MEKMRYLKIHVALLENNAIRCILNKKSHLLLYIYTKMSTVFEL